MPKAKKTPQPKRTGLRPRTKVVDYTPKRNVGATAPAKTLNQVQEIPQSDSAFGQQVHPREDVTMANGADNNLAVESTDGKENASAADEEPKLPVNILEIRQEGKYVAVDVIWCSGCFNGGKLQKCAHCTRKFCDACVKVTDKDTPFECPACFKKRTNKLAVAPPYPYRLLRPSSTRENWAKVSNIPLAIISIRLSGIDSSKTPANGVYYDLLPWLRGNVVLVDIDFDIDHHKENFHTRMAELVNKFNTELKHVSQFLVLLTTHSDPRNGFLHIGPNKSGAVSAKELLEHIFYPPFQEMLNRKKNNLLGILACGALTLKKKSRRELQEFTDRNIFQRVISFSQADFQPTLAFKFFRDVALAHFVFERHSLHHVLRDNITLGAHTSIIEMQPESSATYTWTHRVKRPMGEAVIQQCPDCLVLERVKLRVRKSTGNVTVHGCKNKGCDFERAYFLPSKAEWVFPGDGQEGTRGAWYVLRK